jgi:hypothetical protein
MLAGESTVPHSGAAQWIHRGRRQRRGVHPRPTGSGGERETSALKEILPEQIKQLDHQPSQLLIPHYMGDVNMLLHTHETFKRQNSAFFWKELFFMLCSKLTILISMIFLVQYVQKISILDPNIHNSYTS